MFGARRRRRALGRAGAKGEGPKACVFVKVVEARDWICN